MSTRQVNITIGKMWHREANVTALSLLILFVHASVLFAQPVLNSVTFSTNPVDQFGHFEPTNQISLRRSICLALSHHLTTT